MTTNCNSWASLNIGALVFAIIAFALVLILYGWLPLPLGKPLNTYRLIELACMSVITLVFALQNRAEEKADGLGVTDSVIFVFFIYGLLISLFVDYPLQNLEDLGLLAGVAVLSYYLCCHFSVLDRALIEKQALFLLIPGLCFTLDFALQYMLMLQNGSILSTPYFSNFSNIRQLNNAHCFLVPFFLYFSWARRAMSVRILALVVSVFWIASLLYSGARGVMVSFAFIATVLYWFDRSSRAFIIHAVLMFLASTLLYIVTIKAVPALFLDASPSSYMIRSGSSNRLDLWLLTLGESWRCLFGCGGQSFVAFSAQNLHEAFGSPHNLIIATFFEYGAVGLICLLYLLYQLKYLVFCKQKNFGVSGAARFSVLSVVVYAFFAGIQYSVFFGVLFPFVLAIAVMDIQFQGSVKISRWITTETLYFLLGLMFFVGAALLIIDLVIYYDEIVTQERSWPRFFEVGNYFLYNLS